MTKKEQIKEMTNIQDGCIWSSCEECMVKELIEERNAEIARQENFAKKEGFTPDCSPYYIAMQYKHRAEAAEARLKELQEGKR